MESTAIISFWKAHKRFWFPTTPAEKEEADGAICAAFWRYAWEEETLAGQVIYFDQFARHFQRAGLLKEEEVAAWRTNACILVLKRVDELAGMDEVELTFILMPFKHKKEWNFIFRAIHERWLPVRASQTLLDFSTLQRFYMDTYKKTYTLERLRAGFSRGAERERSYSDVAAPFDAAAICDWYPDEYAADSEAWVGQVHDATSTAEAAPLLKALAPYKGGVVSLSGGVDSMVMLALLVAAGADVKAVHIQYGNRPEAADEAQLLIEYCRRLDVPITLYKIPHIRRGQIDRDFYEAMTRQLRFWVYQCVAEEEPIFLGHIQDDVVENIWTNIASGTHMGDLKKMRAEEMQMGVRLVRPFLGVQKREIYAAAELLAVPYLKNTTPSWSNRGKFREHFHAATVAQFGAGVDQRLVAFAEAMGRQAALVERFVYRPIYTSWDDTAKEVNITTGLEADLDAAGWIAVFDWLCHEKLHVHKPSAKAVAELHRRMQIKYTAPIRVNMNGRLQVVVRWDTAGKGVWMKCVVAPANL